MVRFRQLSMCWIPLAALWAAGCGSEPPSAAVRSSLATEKLRDAAGRGDTAAVKALIANRADVNATVNGGVTALMRASENGHADVVQALLTSGADVNAKANGGVTALMLAAQNGYADAVQMLLAKHADVNAKRNDGVTALILASQAGSIKAVQTLLANGAGINAKPDDGVTALMTASGNGHTEVVQALLARGADVSAKASGTATTALSLAAQEGHREVVSALLDKGADVNATSNDGRTTPLLQASQNGHADVVRTLLAGGADVNAKASDGETALMAASGNGHTDVVQALLANGADINARRNDGATALMEASDTSHGEVVRALLDKGADVSATMNDGRTALMLASDGEVRALLSQTDNGKQLTDNRRLGTVPGATQVNPMDGLIYVWVGAATFTMGCSMGDSKCGAYEKPAHRVTLTKSFWIGRTEVPQGTFEKLTGSNPSDHRVMVSDPVTGRRYGEDLPVNNVTWAVASKFCESVHMRLPTEAEWEYAVRAGYALPSTVVEDWVADWKYDYQAGSQADPKGPATGAFRVIRGGPGGFTMNGGQLVGHEEPRALARHFAPPDISTNGPSFRCAGN